MPKYRSWSGKTIEIKNKKEDILSQTEKVFFKERPSIAKKIKTD